MRGGSLEQQNYRQAPDMTRRRQGMGVRQEEAVFNPRGPGRGGGVINQPAPSHAPGGGNSYMNGMPNEYSNAEGKLIVVIMAQVHNLSSISSSKATCLSCELALWRRRGWHDLTLHTKAILKSGILLVLFGLNGTSV